MADVTKSPYYAAAKEAYDYVKKIMWIGAGNKALDQPAVVGAGFWSVDLGVRAMCVRDSRKETGKVIAPMQQQMFEDRKKAIGEGKYGRDENGKARISREELDAEFAQLRMDQEGATLDIYATSAFVHGCGNCMEQSALTFQHLRDKKVRPLDWIAQDAVLTIPIWDKALGDHAFVIIGRDGKTKIGELSTWNPEVVWCDPYEGELGGLDEIKKRFNGKTLRLFLRME